MGNKKKISFYCPDRCQYKNDPQVCPKTPGCCIHNMPLTSQEGALYEEGNICIGCRFYLNELASPFDAKMFCAKNKEWPIYGCDFKEAEG